MRYTQSFLELLKVFIQSWQGIYWQNFQCHQINIQSLLCLITTKNLLYLNISDWTQQLKFVFKLLKNVEVTKDAGIDQISEKLLKH